MLGPNAGKVKGIACPALPMTSSHSSLKQLTKVIQPMSSKHAFPIGACTALKSS